MMECNLPKAVAVDDNDDEVAFDIADAVPVDDDEAVPETTAEPWCDYLIVVARIMTFTAIMMITDAFYVLGVVFPEKWTFIDNGVKLAWYTTFVVLVGLMSSLVACGYTIGESDTRPRSRHYLTLVLCAAFFIGMPFGLARHFLHAEYDKHCDHYDYEIRVSGNDVYLEDEFLYTIKTTIAEGGDAVFVTTGPIDEHIMTIQFGGVAGVVVGFGAELFMGGVASTNDKWWKSPASFGDQFKMMEDPSNGKNLKICSNTFGNDTLTQTAIVPIMQRQMRTCVKCMDSCMDTCINWHTRIVPYSHTSCSNGHCTTSTRYRSERYCAQYKSRAICNIECRAPSCSGITI